MSADDKKEPPRSTSDEASITEHTQVQTDDAVAASVKLSIPTHVSQHADAPKINGYVLCDKLGQGAYGLVWRSWQLRTRKEVAVKVFMQRSGLDWIFLQREVERLTRLDRHPHIVTMLDTGLDEEPPYYSMDLIEHGSLDRYVSRDGAATPQQTLTWLEQICDAMSYVHARGLIHCDLKPANILVDSNDRVRVVDFGQSRVFTESSASMGTLFYMAPEQAQLSEPGAPVQPDHRWDVYAIGATAYAILTGQAPYATEETVRALGSASSLAERLTQYRNLVGEGGALPWDTGQGPSVSNELRAIILKCLAREPDARYPTVEALAADFRALRSNRPVSPFARRMDYRVKKFIKRNPFLIGMVAVGIGLASALAWTSVQGARLDRARAHEVVSRFVNDPPGALAAWRAARERVRRNTHDLTDRFVESRAYTERIMGARAGALVAPEAFWRSVDSGALWRGGEWLELARMNRLDRVVIVQLLDKASGGSTHEKYAAFCLLGALADDLTDRSTAVERCRNAVVSETDPGVVMAAWWAAQQLGADDMLVSTSDHIFVDELTGLSFVAIRAADSFRRGSDGGDPDHLPDETLGLPIAIKRFHLSTTELTHGTLALYWQFVQRAARDDRKTPSLSLLLGSVPPGVGTGVANGYLDAARAAAYCTWLNEQAKGETPQRTYRLPTEDEWEYASRGGNDARFCFGDDASYAPFFAACNGEVKGYHVVAQHMPNAFGLFDMHGGLWELTSSSYPPEFADPAHRDFDLITIRGGAYYSPARRCRSAQRNYSMRDQPGQYTGLRLVMEIER